MIRDFSVGARFIVDNLRIRPDDWLSHGRQRYGWLTERDSNCTIASLSDSADSSTGLQHWIGQEPTPGRMLVESARIVTKRLHRSSDAIGQPSLRKITKYGQYDEKLDPTPGIRL